MDAAPRLFNGRWVYDCYDRHTWSDSYTHCLRCGAEGPVTPAQARANADVLALTVAERRKRRAVRFWRRTEAPFGGLLRTMRADMNALGVRIMPQDENEQPWEWVMSRFRHHFRHR